MSGRIFFWVQHLLGIGHLRRAVTIARTLAEAGHEVLLVSGGLPVADLPLGRVRFRQLPPVRAKDRLFKVLCHPDGTEIDDDFRARRTALLLDLYREHRPDLVLTEMFPFGRRQLRFELLPLLQAVADDPRRPLLAASVRDILVQSPKPERIAEMLDIFERHFDLVMIHGDENLIPFGRTFPAAQRIADRIRYTGYVLDADLDRPPSGDSGKNEVIVSAGGGAVGGPLLSAALAARPATVLKDHRWRLLAGPNLPAADFDALMVQAGGQAGADIVIERARRDFTTLLSNCALSISQGGYNTMIETLCFADRAVVVPYAGGLETEQALRAALLAESGVLEVVDEADLDGPRLAAAVDRRMAGPSIRSVPRCDANGRTKTLALVHELLVRRIVAGAA